MGYSLFFWFPYTLHSDEDEYCNPYYNKFFIFAGAQSTRSGPAVPRCSSSRTPAASRGGPCTSQRSNLSLTWPGSSMTSQVSRDKKGVLGTMCMLP